MSAKPEIISGSWNRVKNWVNTRIRIPLQNTFIGVDAGKETTGDFNSFMGYQAGYKTVAATYNTFMGYKAGYSNLGGGYNSFMGGLAGANTTSGAGNSFIGYGAGYYNTTGASNNFMGYRAGYSNTDGVNNNFMGYMAGYLNEGGSGNTGLGYKAGYTNVGGHYSVCIGNEAGFYETVGSKLFIDDRARTNEADGRIKALIYGIFAAATADQRLSINGQLLVREVATYANDAAAGTGGLVTGEFYKHADGSLHIKL